MTRLLDRSQKAIWPLPKNSRSTLLRPLLLESVSAPEPATVTGCFTTSDLSASSVSRLVLAQLSAAVTSISLAMPPVETATSPLARMAVKSSTLSTAFFAVAVHTPAAQETFSVGLDEIARSALADATASADNAIVSPAAAIVRPIIVASQEDH